MVRRYVRQLIAELTSLGSLPSLLAGLSTTQLYSSLGSYQKQDPDSLENSNTNHFEYPRAEEEATGSLLRLRPKIHAKR